MNVYQLSGGTTTSTEATDRELAQLLVFPNPATERIFVQGPLTPEQFTLTDLNGRVVRSGRFASSGVPVVGLPAGVYLLRLETAGVGSTVRRVMVR